MEKGKCDSAKHCAMNCCPLNKTVRSFYDPLIKPQFVGSHYFWANFHIPEFNIGNRNHRNGTVETLQERKQIDLSNSDIIGKRQLLRNCVEPELGLHVLSAALKQKQVLLNSPVTAEKVKQK
jgi:DNA (cytosine-5)-methyltransferase 1